MHKQRQKTNQGEVLFVIFEGENGKYVCTAMPSHPHIRDTQLSQIFLLKNEMIDKRGFSLCF